MKIEVYSVKICLNYFAVGTKNLFNEFKEIYT
jgi:hypothetical protein